MLERELGVAWDPDQQDSFVRLPLNPSMEIVGIDVKVCDDSTRRLIIASNLDYYIKYWFSVFLEVVYYPD